MKILLHGINYAPELTGVGKYTGELGAWLAAQGHEVRVVTAPPYYPAWQVAPPYSARRYRTETLDGVRVTRVPLYVPANPVGYTRILHLLSFALCSLPVMLAQVLWRPDVVIVFEPTFTVLPQAWLTARLAGAKAWLHVQDFEVDAAFRLGMMGGGSAGIAARLAGAFEAWWMRRFDRVSAISESMRKRLLEKGVPQASTVLFQNWADLKPYQTAAAVRNANAALAGLASAGLRPPVAVVTSHKRPAVLPAGKRIVLYAGNMGEKQGLEGVLEVAARLHARLADVQFVLCGDGAAKPRLVAEAERRRLTNVTFLPLQPAADFPHVLAAADVHLVIQRKGAADLVMPSKLIAIMATGGAAVVTAAPGTELHTVATRHGVARAVPPEDPEALAETVARLLADDQERQTLGAAASAYAAGNLAKEAILARFLAALLHA